MGVVTGSSGGGMGDENGYPEQKYHGSGSLSEIVGTKEADGATVRYYELVPISLDRVQRAKAENREAERLHMIERAEREAEAARARLEELRR